MKTTPNKRFGVLPLHLVIWCVLLGFAQVAHAQVASAYKVGRVEVKFIGPTSINEQVVRANMQLREGESLDDTLIDRDIRSLYRTGLFEFIEVKRDARPDRVINLLFEMTPKFRVLSVKYEGNSKVKTRRLEKEVKTKSNTSLDERQVKEDVEKIREYYQKTGYNQVQISYNIERNRTTGFGNVIFKIKEGNRVKIKRINFTGNEHVTPRKLRKEMETKKYGIFSWLTGSGRFKDDQFEDDLDKIRDYYREQGYLDVEVPADKVEYKYPKPTRLTLNIHIKEGRQYRIGEISITGNKIISTPKLRRVIRQKSGKIFAPSLIEKDVTALDDAYGSGGYIETRTRLIRRPNLATGNIDIEYSITEGEKFFVESVKVEGNTKTKSVVIIRELALGPGEVFDSVRMKNSKLRLENTRFFDDVNMTPETTSIPGRKNLKVAVKEGRTGNLTFGAGFSTLEQVVVFAEVSQSNFDIFNRKSFFQGDGQKFRIRVQLGTRSSEAIISFEEPWLFQQRLALGFNLFRSQSDYNSSVYSELRTGGEVYLRKRLFELVEGRLSYSIENVEISKVDSGFERIFPPGSELISKVGFQLLRDTRDKLINTTRGNRAEVLTEMAGGPFGGDRDYYKVEFRGAQFFNTFEAQNQVLAVIARTGVLDPYGDTKEIPFYDRFYLGGPYTLRGFKYRDVGPRDKNLEEPVGGNTYGFLSLEYTVDIVDPVRFAFFYDAGYVNSGSYDFNPGKYNDNFGFGLRLFIAGAPLSLDYGIPITSDPQNDGSGQFNFSFGTRF